MSERPNTATHRVARPGAVAAAALVLTLVFAGVAAAASPKTKRMSVSSSGAQGNATSSTGYSPAISANGRFVAFDSLASNLVAGDTNGYDVFVRKVKTGKTRRISVRSNGGQANNSSHAPAISANGSLVAFHSAATNLVAGDTNGWDDIFVRNLKSGKTRRVSVSSGGIQGSGESGEPAMSANGRFVAFHSLSFNLGGDDTNFAYDVFVRNLKTRKTRRVSVSSSGAQANDNSFAPSLSANGRFVAFRSSASNLVAGDTNGEQDVFVRNLKSGKTRRVSVSSSGAQGDGQSSAASISADGRSVAFMSWASNMVVGDTNDERDVFVRNLKTRKTRRVSVSSSGAQGNGVSVDPAISANRRFVAFMSTATNLVGGDTNGEADIFRRGPLR